MAVIGRANAGKSTLLNALVQERIALVSHKAGATRKRQLVIVMHHNSQIIFIDTPGLDNRRKELNLYMQKETEAAQNGADLVLFVADMADSAQNYARFLEANAHTKHIVALTKMDNFNHSERLAKLAQYQQYSDHFAALVPISATRRAFAALLDEVEKCLPIHEYYFDPDELTDQSIRDICKEMIREQIFQFVSDEVPYEADVIIDRFEESLLIDKIYAKIFVEKSSQKAIVIGAKGAVIKKIGTAARKMIEAFSQKKVYLELSVEVARWSQDKQILKKLGYDTD